MSNIKEQCHQQNEKNWSLNVTKELFKSFRDAITYKKNHHNWKSTNNSPITFLNYEQYHTSMMEKLTQEKYKISENQQNFNAARAVTNEYFNAVKDIIFDFVIYKEDEDSEINLTEEISKYKDNTTFFNNEEIVKKNKVKEVVYFDIMNILFMNFTGNKSVETKSDKFELQYPNEKNFLNASGGSCSTCMISGGNSLNVTFKLGSMADQAHYIVKVYYNIILHMFYEVCNRAWQIVERHTAKLNDIDKSGEKGPKLHKALWTCVNEAYKEFNSLVAIRRNF